MSYKNLILPDMKQQNTFLNSTPTHYIVSFWRKEFKQIFFRNTNIQYKICFWNDHGLDDPLIPVEGTIDYYHRMREIHGGQNFINQFCRLYINPGDGHGNCHTNGPGMTESTGIQALMNWVEHNKAPENLPAVLVNQKNGKTIRKGIVKPWRV